MKKFNIKVEDVYKKLGEYTYYKGFNINAIITLIIFISFLIVFEPLYGPKILILELMKEPHGFPGF